MLFKAQSGKFKANKVLEIFMICKKNKAKAFHSALNIEMRGFLEWNSSNTGRKMLLYMATYSNKKRVAFDIILMKLIFVMGQNM